MPLKDGDIITLDYEGRTEGILFDTTLEKVAKKNQLCALRHNSFWKCMDTSRDKKVLEEIFKKNIKTF